MGCNWPAFTASVTVKSGENRIPSPAQADSNGVIAGVKVRLVSLALIPLRPEPRAAGGAHRPLIRRDWRGGEKSPTLTSLALSI